MEAITRTCKVIFKKQKVNFMSKNNFAFLMIVISLILLLAPGDNLKWLGASLCMFSAITNDSVQILGTFLSSNKKVKWYKLFAFIGILFATLMILTYNGWLSEAGRLDFLRLKQVPYDPNHTMFHFLAPILLILFTYNKIPVSSTFLILSVFAPQGTIGAMLLKTFIGYGVGLVLAYIVWKIIATFLSAQVFIEPKLKIWKSMQWITTAILFASWVINDIGNTTVFLPRIFDWYSLTLFLLLGLSVIAFAIYNKGGPIQAMVDEKCNMDNLKSASITNSLYAFIILVVSRTSPIPMATTWIFLGILAGQEMALVDITLGKKNTFKEAFLYAKDVCFKDVILAGTGLLISLIFALVNNVYVTRGQYQYLTKLEVLVYDNNIELEFEVPTSSLNNSYFENLSKSRKTALINDDLGHDTNFIFNKEANCKLLHKNTKNKIIEKKVEFNYLYNCKNIKKVKNIKVNFGNDIEKINGIDIDVINSLTDSENNYTLWNGKSNYEINLK